MCLIWINTNSIAQPSIDSAIAFINSQHPDTLGMYTRFCSRSQLTLFLWKKDGNYFITNASSTQNKTHILDSISPLKYYFENQKVIDHEKVKPFTFIAKNSSSGKLDTLQLNISHSCYSTFVLFGSNMSEKIVSDFDLQENFSRGEVNIYSKSNSQNRLVIFFSKVKELTTKFNWDKPNL